MIYLDFEIFYTKIKFGPWSFVREKVKIIYFSKLLVSVSLCNMEMQLTLTDLNSRGEGHLATLPKCHLVKYFNVRN